MLLDFYELTMANGYFKLGVGNQTAVFDMFFRKIPDQAGFAICAGLEQLIDYFENLHFTKEDIEYLRGRGMFDEDFLDYLANFHFECDVWAVPEGTPDFPQRTGADRKGADYSGAAGGNNGTFNHQSPISDRYQIQPDCPRGTGTLHYGIWIAPGPKLRRRHFRRTGRVYRRVRCNGLRDRRPGLPDSGSGNNGSQLGSDVR